MKYRKRVKLCYIYIFWRLNVITCFVKWYATVFGVMRDVYQKMLPDPKLMCKHFIVNCPKQAVELQESLCATPKICSGTYLTCSEIFEGQRPALCNKEVGKNRCIGSFLKKKKEVLPIYEFDHLKVNVLKHLGHFTQLNFNILTFFLNLFHKCSLSLFNIYSYFDKMGHLFGLFSKNGKSLLR